MAKKSDDMVISEHEGYAGWLARIVAAVNLIVEPNVSVLLVLFLYSFTAT